MKKILYILIAISLVHQFTTAQWVQQVSGVTTSLLDMDFIDQNTGWACGDGGVIVKTTNGGVNWVQQNSGVINRLEGIDAVDSNTLYCVGFFQTILKSTNGGSNWIIIREGAGANFFKTFFLNQNTGWILRNSGYVLRTTNGGITFDSSFVNNAFPRDIYFKNSLTGILCANGAFVAKSTDGGVTWIQIFLPLSGGLPNLYRLSFVGDFGWTIGEGDNTGLGKLVFKTTNFGSNWDTVGRVQYPNTTVNYSVCFASVNTGYCGGTFGHIFKSTNGGSNWIQQNVPIDGFRNDFWFANDSIGWVTGGGGYILKTTNGGTYLYIEPVSNIIPTNFKLNQNYPNPFNGVTIITFDVYESTDYKLEIFDLLGQKIYSVFSKTLNRGSYKVNYNADNISSGTYFYKLSSQKNSEVRKFVLIK